MWLDLRFEHFANMLTDDFHLVLECIIKHGSACKEHWQNFSKVSF
jgi:hypothetical protein